MFRPSSSSLSRVRLLTASRRYASSPSTSSSSSSSLLLQSGIAINLALSGYLIYTLTALDERAKKSQEALEFGMDRIDECLNRIDLRNNETTGYFETVSKKVEELEQLKKKKK